MNIVHRDKCPLCGREQLKKNFTCVDHSATQEQFDICECEACGLRFTQDIPVEAEIGRYYETPDYISHSDTRKGLMNKVYHWVRSYMLGSKARLAIRLSGTTRGTVLDIGAGTGYFAHEMQLRGWNILAADKSEQARNFAKEHFDINEMKTEELANIKEASLDVITMWHVMEHVEHLDEEWKMLSRLLKESGILIIAVPNSDSCDAVHYGADWAAYDVPRHLWHFTIETMRKLGRKHGFRLIRTEAMPFDAFYISMLSEKNRGRSAYFLRGMWRGLKCLNKAFGRTERSSSIIYVFKKSI